MPAAARSSPAHDLLTGVDDLDLDPDLDGAELLSAIAG
jgi:hypothetical protein